MYRRDKENNGNTRKILKMNPVNTFKLTQAVDRKQRYFKEDCQNADTLPEAIRAAAISIFSDLFLYC